MQPAIEVFGLGKSFGRQAVLAGLDFTVAPGEVFALLGPNGAGKTTTINILTTLPARRGHSDRRRHRRPRRPRTGEAADQPHRAVGRGRRRADRRGEPRHARSALGSVAFRRPRSRPHELLDRFDLADAADKRVGAYSGGMRRRLDLALSFVVAPEILFLDEPTTGLDTRSRRELWDAIRSLARAGTTVFLTTQYLEEADQLADRVAVLDEGRSSRSERPRS